MPSPKSLRRTAHRTLRWSESNPSLWHNVLFMVNIGAPVLVGLLIGHAPDGIAGAVAGLLFSLSDSDESLPKRLALLARTAGVMIGLGILGHLFGGFTTAFWLIFLVLAFATAWLSVQGHSVASALRYGALALIAMADLPSAGLATLGMVLVAVIASAATRAIGARFFPQVETISLRVSITQSPHGWAGWRYCLVYAGAVAVGLVVGKLEGTSRPTWVATTVLLVMQPEARASYERIVQRILGTFVGVLAATAVISLLHSVWPITAAVLLIAFFVPHGATRNYWVYAALIALLVLVLYDFASVGHPFDSRLLAERMRDVLLGSALGLVGTLLAFPLFPRQAANSGQPGAVSNQLGADGI